MNKSEIAEPLEATAGRWLRERGIHSAEINLAAVLSEFHLSVMDRIVENERAIAESQAPQTEHVTMQMLINTGLNAFGLQLFCESFANIPKKPTDLQTPFSFIFRGLTFTVSRTEGEEIDTRHH